MNSRDPWDPLITDPAGNVLWPRAYYGHPFYRSGPTRQLFEDAFISGDPRSTGKKKNMHNIGAELTALSAPGGFFGYGRPFGYGGYSPYGNGGYNQFGYRGYAPYGGFGGFGNRPYILGQDAEVVDVEVTRPIERRGLVAEVGPILAPATGGISVRKYLDDNRVLHVEICVDGKCHSTSMDLAPAIEMLLGKLASWHQAQHAAQAAPETVVSTVDQAVREAEKLIVGALVTRHVNTVASGLLGDIAGAVSGLVRGATGAVKGVGSGLFSTFQRLRKPIGIAAGIAAAAGTALIPGVGPIAAPLAAKLANDLVQATAGDPAAQQAVAQAATKAKTDPAVAAALDQATNAVANSTAAHHVQETAKAAAQGNPAAQQQIVQVATDAEQGDPAAKAVAALIQNAMSSEWGAKLWEQTTGRGPDVVSGGWYDVVGQAIDDVRVRATEHARTKPGVGAGVLITVDGRLHGRGFRNLDDAVAWLDHITRNRASFTYAAAFEKDSNGNAFIQAEEIGGAQQRTPQQSSPIRRDVATVY